LNGEANGALLKRKTIQRFKYIPLIIMLIAFIASSIFWVFYSGGTSGTSGVIPDHFDIIPISSPQTAGSTFPVTVIARDIHGSMLTGYSEMCNLSDSSGVIDDNPTGKFEAGKVTIEITINKALTQDTIVANSQGQIGTSNPFDIMAADLDHFEVSDITTQTVAQPFQISITAKDKYGNSVVSFLGQVKIADLTGTIIPTMSGDFTSGAWTGNITIKAAKSSNIITVTSGEKSGSSNAFDASLAP
jgi:hypothetical protein